MFRPLQGVYSSISIGRIEIIIFTANNIYSTNITRNLPRDFILIINLKRSNICGKH